MPKLPVFAQLAFILAAVSLLPVSAEHKSIDAAQHLPEKGTHFTFSSINGSRMLISGDLLIEGQITIKGKFTFQKTEREKTTVDFDYFGIQMRKEYEENYLYGYEEHLVRLLSRLPI